MGFLIRFIKSNISVIEFNFKFKNKTFDKLYLYYSISLKVLVFKVFNFITDKYNRY